MEYVTLNNKLECPVVGIGTFMLSPADAENSVREALKMKKQFPTFIQEGASGFESVFVSAGKVGYQIELSPVDLMAVSGCKEADIIV